MIGDAAQCICEPGLRVDGVELGGADERIDGRGALAAAVGAGEEPGFAAEGDAAQRAFGGVIGQADAAVVEEAGEGGPALEHVIDSPWRSRRDARDERARHASTRRGR